MRSAPEITDSQRENLDIINRSGEHRLILINDVLDMAKIDAGRLILVQDNAGGIPAEILPQIFDPYFTTKEQGNGIGLYMTRKIVTLDFNGSVEVSNRGDGALFTLMLPLLEERR